MIIHHLSSIVPLSLFFQKKAWQPQTEYNKEEEEEEEQACN
jgi:hypothetical protein